MVWGAECPHVQVQAWKELWGSSSTLHFVLLCSSLTRNRSKAILKISLVNVTHSLCVPPGFHMALSRTFIAKNRTWKLPG